MEKRLYFVLGDLLVNSLAGVAAAVSAHALLAPSAHPFVTMPLGMCVGAVSASVVAFLFMPFLGAFEVMLPAMLTGMVAGMTAPMIGAPAPTGASIGLAVVAWVYFLTAMAARSRDGRSSRA
jgi:hypothetical protein